MITAAGMFNVGQSLRGRCRRTRNLAPHSRLRAGALALPGLKSQAFQLAIKRYQLLKLFAAAIAVRQMRNQNDRIPRPIRMQSGFFEEPGQLGRSQMFFELAIQSLVPHPSKTILTAQNLNFTMGIST